MTSEELKNNLYMRDVIAQYGIKTINNMAHCPFHGKDKHPSMKVFKDGYKCFACNAGGDIFSFVMQINSCDFKTAFILLGGTYEKLTGRDKQVAQMKLAKKREEADRKKKAEQELQRILVWLTDLIHECDKLDPFSNEWCVIKNYEPLIWDIWHERSMGKEINELDVFRIYREIRHQIIAA